MRVCLQRLRRGIEIAALAGSTPAQPDHVQTSGGLQAAVEEARHGDQQYGDWWAEVDDQQLPPS